MTTLHGNQTVSTWYGEVPAALLEQLRQVRLLICDVDGVFSDGRIYLGNAGEELKAFHTRDGLGIKAIVQQQIQVAVVTGRRSQIVEQRMQALGVQHIMQGCEDKGAAMQQLVATLQLSPSQVACIGDDVADLPMMLPAGVSIAVFDAHPYVQQQAHYVTVQRGGFGAVREVCDLLLLSQGQLHVHGGMSV